jgi:hypothetical protein
MRLNHVKHECVDCGVCGKKVEDERMQCTKLMNPRLPLPYDWDKYCITLLVQAPLAMQQLSVLDCRPNMSALHTPP